MVKHLQLHHWRHIARANALHPCQWSDDRLASAHLHLDNGYRQRGISNPDCGHSIRTAYKPNGGDLRRLLGGRNDRGSHLHPVGDGAEHGHHILLGSPGPCPLGRPEWGVVERVTLRYRRSGFFAERFSQQFDAQPWIERYIDPNLDAD